MKVFSMAGLTSKLFVAGGVCVGMLAVSVPASADTFATTFFSVTTSTNTTGNDFHTGNVGTGTNSSNYVKTGPWDLVGNTPVYNGSESGAAGASDLSPGGELGWWTAGSNYDGVNQVTETGNMNFNLSSDTSHPSNMFPPNSTGTDNTGGFEETAILSGDFFLASAGSVNFTIAADDDAFVYIDGLLVADLGGIHATESLNFTPSLGAGWHTIEIFYADQDEVAATLAFNDGGTPISATPEPGSLALLGTGVLGLAGAVRRRMMR
jgi:fibro-slime domain-containing protein